MPLVATEYACPLCKAANLTSQINASDGALTCSMNPSNVWRDIQAFKDLKPRMEFTVSQPKFQPQINHVEMKVMVPLGIKTTLETKMAGKLEATVAGILSMLAEGDILIIPSQDLDRMKQRLGKKPESSGELFGMLFALGEQVTEAKQIAETASNEVKAYESRSPGSVVIDLGAHFTYAVEKAKDENMPVKLWIQDRMKNALENQWF
jgi:hypothetical protein